MTTNITDNIALRIAIFMFRKYLNTTVYQNCEAQERKSYEF